MKKGIIFFVVFFMMLGNAFAFDKDMAKKFDAMFSQLTPEALTLRPCQVTTKDVLTMIKNNEKFLFLDVRTPAEQKVVAPTYKNTLFMPMHEVFKEANLSKLPKDMKIVVICHTADRATAVTIGLRAIGFINAYQFKGGIAELASGVGRTASEYVKD